MNALQIAQMYAAQQNLLREFKRDDMPLNEIKNNPVLIIALSEYLKVWETNYEALSNDDRTSEWFHNLTSFVEAPLMSVADPTEFERRFGIDFVSPDVGLARRKNDDTGYAMRVLDIVDDQLVNLDAQLSAITL